MKAAPRNGARNPRTKPTEGIVHPPFQARPKPERFTPDNRVRLTDVAGIKVTGPGSGVPDAGAPEAAPVPEPGRGGEAGAPDAAKGAADAKGAAGPAAADPLTADIAAELAAGKLGAHAALDRIVERVVDQQLGADAPAPAREKLRAALHDALAQGQRGEGEMDPFLAEKLRRL